MKHDNYKPLKLASVNRETCVVPTPFNPSPVEVGSPALLVMTDLAKIPAATIAPGATFVEANQAMIHRGVRMLFVTDTTHQLLGVVTSTDLLGEKPVQIAQRRGVRRHELLVEHLMTSADHMEAMSMADVSRAHVGDIVATFKEVGRQHIIAVERDADQQLRIRGVFSAAQVARQLGVQLSMSERARTFAEIEAAIAGV